MRKTRKKLLLTSAAVAVVAFSMAPGKAHAFDSVNWEWDQTVTSTVTSDITVALDATPTGMVDIEKMQVQIGDVTANSTVSNVNNNPPEGEGAGGQSTGIDESLTIDAFYDDNAEGNPILSGTITSDGFLTGTNLAGNVDNNDNSLHLTFDLSGEDPDPQALPGENDALDLPLIVSAATAVGNNQQIESDVALNLHDGQFLFGGFADGEAGDNAALLETVLGATPDTDNTHTEIAAGLTFAAALGLITPATVTATSDVSAILNASVDSTATAVGNNMSVDVAAATPSDAFMIADITQFSYADVSATSTVDDITLNGYTGFGAAGMGPGGLGEDAPQIPLVNSVATAVGNNLSITVAGPGEI